MSVRSNLFLSIVNQYLQSLNCQYYVSLFTCNPKTPPQVPHVTVALSLHQRTPSHEGRTKFQEKHYRAIKNLKIKQIYVLSVLLRSRILTQGLRIFLNFFLQKIINKTAPQVPHVSVHQNIKYLLYKLLIYYISVTDN